MRSFLVLNAQEGWGIDLARGGGRGLALDG